MKGKIIILISISILLSCKIKVKKDFSNSTEKLELISNNKVKIIESKNKQNNSDCFNIEDIKGLKLLFKTISEKKPISSLETKFKFNKKDFCISVITHNPVMLAITSLSNIFSPKYLRFIL